MRSYVGLAVIACLIALAAPSRAGDLYNNGPINGMTDAWNINFGFATSDSFTLSTGISTITQLSFGAWLFPGDVLESAEVSITSQALGQGTTYFDQIVNFTQSGCSGNQLGFNICTETGDFNGPTLGNGTYWLTLQSAVVNTGDPVYWDENSGVGCTSPGCPSIAYISDCIQNGDRGCIPSESFTLSGNSGATVPEPSSFLLFGSSVLTVVGVVRRRFQ
jgi:hypothetical protein